MSFKAQVTHQLRSSPASFPPGSLFALALRWDGQFVYELHPARVRAPAGRVLEGQGQAAWVVRL